LAAAAFLQQLDAAHVFRYHQHFLDNNPNNPYIVYNDLPKLAALKKQYPEMCKR
jgi:hypothetical protein